MELKNIFNIFKFKPKNTPFLPSKGDGFKTSSLNTPKSWHREQQRLMKSRPLDLEQSYALCEDVAKILEAFQYVSTIIIALCQKKSEQGDDEYFFERGKTSNDRSYLFIQPFNSPGWLFEQGPAGWTLSYARKISQQDLFVRQGEVIDIATVYVSSVDRAQIRVSSPYLYGSSLYTLDYYAENIMRRLREKSFLLEKNS